MKHAFDISEAFEKFYSGPSKYCKNEKDSKTKTESSNTSNVVSSSSTAGSKSNNKNNKKGKRSPPSPCPLPSCKGRIRLHWISDYTDSTHEEKKKYREELSAQKAGDGPSKLTRSQISGSASKTVGRVQETRAGPEHGEEYPSCRMTVRDCQASLDLLGRCDDGADETLASKEIAEKAVLHGIGKLEAIETVSLKVSLKKKMTASPSCSRERGQYQAPSFICPPANWH